MRLKKQSLLTMVFLTMFSLSGFAVTSPQQKEIEKIIHDYLLKNPEILQESFLVLQEKEQQKMMEGIKKNITENIDPLFNSQSPFVGIDDPKVVIVEFFDYQCAHCKNVKNTLENVMSSNKDIRVVFKELPIFGDTSLKASQATLAAAKQNKYVELHKKLMSTTEPLTEEKIMHFAKELGLDIEKLKKDMLSDNVNKEINDNKKLALKLGVRGTPAFIIGSYPAKKSMIFDFIPGEVPQNTIQTAIDKTRSQQQ